ncbi:cAMP-dependent protein kinase regulatory subunit-like isoform X2 [Pieris brassicae]|uniref:cAMP-dependent protein kinase regulatory subunit-like isoform X2 n=1 Tax=Pieris brassicae TaxID=7116 RepID=UPI001E65E8EB|nr:cAMP-dependent protein kinase regulatory subunit-like isoform X2 [Pieris brassicae]
MAGRGGPKKELDPEELMKRKFRAKCLFRALGRMVMSNAYWLIEAVDHYEGLDDVKRRVEQAVRGKAKKKQLLTIHDKALLNKPAEERTDQEKKYIFRIIGGLKCFKRYPNHVKKKLAAVTYFKYYGPGRPIVRQHQEAHALYFIITGDVVVSQMVYDELLQQYVSIEVGAMQSGDMFGEVSLLHNIPRTATVTTTGHCELLALMKEDFKNVLQASVQKQWDEVRRAMSAFTYFDALDEVPKEESEQDFDTKYFGAYKNLKQDSKSTEGRDSVESKDPNVKSDAKASILKHSSTAKRGSQESERHDSIQIVEDKPRTSGESVSTETKSQDFLIPSGHRVMRPSVRLSVISEKIGLPRPPQNLHTYFMQVCQLNPGSSFGFGENMRDRRIVALTPVACMLLPKIWLLQRNTANIWTRIEHYLEKKIPTKKQLFKEFTSQRRWQEFREELVDDVIARSNTVNWTSVHDVPYSIRMEEMLDI